MSKQLKQRLFGDSLNGVLAALILLQLGACSGTNRRESPDIPKFESVALVNAGASDELKARFGVATENSNSDTGALAGAGAGAMRGGQLSGYCSEYAIVCALFAVPAGALVGAVGGALESFAADSRYRFSEEQLAVLETLFAQVLDQRVISQEIERSLMAQIPADRLTEIPEADTLLQYRLYDVRFLETTSGEYALLLKTVMLFGWKRNSAKPVSTHRTYEHFSDSLKIEEWVEDDGMTINLAFDSCIKGLTEKMVADIQFLELQ